MLYNENKILADIASKLGLCGNRGHSDDCRCDFKIDGLCNGFVRVLNPVSEEDYDRCVCGKFIFQHTD